MRLPREGQLFLAKSLDLILKVIEKLPEDFEAGESYGQICASK